MITVVIPCFNDGHYLSDAVESVLQCSNVKIEVIIVNDGSNDSFTISVLNKFHEEGIMVINQPNQGLGSARNTGIKKSTYDIILPLDADNRIIPSYITKGLYFLKAQKCDIVYGSPEFFGENISSRKFQTRTFGGSDLLYGNYIDACAIFKKSVWEKVGGYDEKMPYQGYEDWDFWLRCFFHDYRFQFINERSFYYRISSHSMIGKSGAEVFEETRNYLFLKYKNQIIKRFNQSYVYESMYINDHAKPLRSSLKYFAKFLKNWIGFR
ncbi:glycosyltransferase family 2 protein [Mucilaginibacter pallidiroseus]|uniref:glycosyltransferase family 2 protein n=1 Tax=Mucilaginibacter pallidiroseus TaxID=2599295 RepID=UPI001646FA00|nr:glycosyltransferase [Mucilaginibacter pallidiroseus]